MRLNGCQTLVLVLVALFAIIIVANCVTGLTGSTQTTVTATPVPSPAITPTRTQVLEPGLTPKPSLDPGGWKKETFTDGLTGKPIPTVLLTAVWSSGAYSILSGEEPAQFFLSCHRDGGLIGGFLWPGAYIVGDLLPELINDDGDVPVEYILDGVSHSDRWEVVGREGLAIPTSDLPDFLFQVSSAKVLGIQVLDSDVYENDQQARYEVTGLDWALEQLPCAVPSDLAPPPTSTQQVRQPSPTPTTIRTPTPTPTATPTPITPPVATSTPSPTPTPDPGGGWETFTYIDNLTEKSHPGILLVAVWSAGGLLESVNITPAQLVFKCDHEAGLFGYLEWPDSSFLYGDPFNGNKLPVEYVVDEARHTAWWIEYGGGAVRVAPEDLQVFIDRVSSAASLGIQFRETEWFENNEKARFEISGISWALRQLPCSIPPLMTTLSQTKQSLVRVEVHDAAGSGVVIGKNHDRSLVVTAWHVIESFCHEVGSECVGVSVVAEGERYHGRLSSFNRQEDIAVLDVEGVLPAARLASEVPQIGTAVVTIGLPEGDHDFQFNEGRVVRHSGCSFESCLATNARAWSGFSGGALINLDGEIVGVISEGWTGSYYSNAVSVDAIRALLQP